MNEAETRAELIDPAIKATGWGVVEGSRVRVVPFGYPPEGTGTQGKKRRKALSEVAHRERYGQEFK